MKKVYLHIGPHKTGSTYIQKALYENKIQLQEAGLNYPSDEYTQNFAHHRLAELYFTKKFVQAQALLKNLIGDNTDDIILSSENFDRLDSVSVNQLKQDLSCYNTKIIFFSRRISDLLVSNWQEDVKHGYTLSWGEYAYKHILKPFQSNVINKNKILDVYADSFGVESIIILDYSFYEYAKRDIFIELLSLIDVKIEFRKDKNVQINKSLAYARIELIRALNSMYSHSNKKVNHFVRTAFLDYVKNNPNCSDVAAVEDIIKEGYTEVNMGSAFTIKHLDNLFIGKYGNNIIETTSYEDVEKTYLLPDSDWIFNPIASSKTERLKGNIDNFYEKVLKI
ncbi:hypothetical protein [Cobetia marina]|uniref:hypothetical protein n=1 Tax=Cobetia marina TaxID=28258 RepID=UPI003857C37A